MDVSKPGAAWLDAHELTAWQDLLAVAAIVSRRVEQQLKDEAGLSHPQYEILVGLSAAPNGELRMTELAGAAVTSKSGPSYQVTQLEKSGLVRCRSCDTDNRAEELDPPADGGRRLLDGSGQAVDPARMTLCRF